MVTFLMGMLLISSTIIVDVEIKNADSYIIGEPLSFDFVMKPKEDIYLYKDVNFDLDLLLGTYIQVNFKDESGNMFELVRWQIPKYPQNNSTIKIKKGETMSLPVHISTPDFYYINSQNDTMLFQLPPGKYTVTCKIEVEDNSISNNAGLTPIKSSTCSAQLLIENSYERTLH